MILPCKPNLIEANEYQNEGALEKAYLRKTEDILYSFNLKLLDSLEQEEDHIRGINKLDKKGGGLGLKTEVNKTSLLNLFVWVAKLSLH